MAENIVAVSLVLGLLILSLWFLRRKGLAKFNLAAGGRRSAPGRIQLVDRKPFAASGAGGRTHDPDRLVAGQLSGAAQFRGGAGGPSFAGE